MAYYDDSKHARHGATKSPLAYDRVGLRMSVPSFLELVNHPRFVALVKEAGALRERLEQEKKDSPGYETDPSYSAYTEPLTVDTMLRRKKTHLMDVSNTRISFSETQVICFFVLLLSG